MKKKEVEIGKVYVAKISGKLSPVKLLQDSRYGGWDAKNLRTGHVIRIKSAQKLRRELTQEEYKKCRNKYLSETSPEPLTEGAKTRRREILQARIKRCESTGLKVLSEFESEKWAQEVLAKFTRKKS